MTWEDQGLWFTLILNGAALAILIPIAYFLHTTKILSIARIYRPNHTIEPEEPPSYKRSAFDDKHPDPKTNANKHPEARESSQSDHPAVPASDRDSRVAEENIPEEKVFNPHDDSVVGIREVGRSPGYESTGERNDKEGAVPSGSTQAAERIKTGRVDPNRKSSLFSFPPLKRLLSVGEEPWEGDEDDQPLRRDPHADLFLLFVKVCLVLFLIGTALSTAWLAVACGLDNYIYRLAIENDPAECRGSSLGDCNDNPLCAWDGVSCQPAPRRGLYDLSLQNATPKSSRLWAVGILAFLFSILCAYVFYRALRSITAYNKRVMKRQLKCAIGYRTVLVKGLDLPPKDVVEQHIKTEEMSIYRADPDNVTNVLEEKISVGVVPEVIPGYPGSDLELFKREYLSAQSYFGDSNGKVSVGGKLPLSTLGGSKKTIDDLALFEGRDSAGVSNKIEEVVMEREAHKKFYKFYDEYEKAKTDLQDAIADERRYHEDLKIQRQLARRLLADGTVRDKQDGKVTYEVETDMPPLMGRIIPSSHCCSKVPVVEYRKNDLIKKGEKLNEAILEGRSKPFTGSVFIIFKDALSAFEFSKLFDQKFGGPCSSLSARVAGPYEKVELSNLSRSKYILAIILVLMSFAFFILVFFWSVPVGFLGSLDSLASIPGIGPAFQTFIDKVPTTIVGILTAYLPVIVLAIFNIILPMLIRFFVVSGGTLTELDTDHGVLWEMYLFLVLTGVVFQAALQGGLAQLGNIISDPSQDVIFAFITAVISPKGGYWYAKIIGAGCLSMWLNALVIGPFVIMFLLAKRANTQRSYNAMFDRQKQDWPLRYAFTLVVTTIGFFFHVTVPLLGIFVGIFFLNQYLVYRGLLLDGWAPDKPPDQLISNFRLSSATFRIMAWCYLIATVGAAIVVGLKEHVGGTVFCCLAVAVSLFILIFTYYTSHQWHPTLKNVEAALAAPGSEYSQQQEKKQLGRNNSEPITPGTAISIPEEAKDKTIVPTSDETDLEDEDTSPLAVAVKELKPYHSKHKVITKAVNMKDTIDAAETKKYGVQMVWHSDEQREKLEEEHAKENEKEAKKLAKEIASGKHKSDERTKVVLQKPNL